MRFASLGSGSQGNALIVEAGRTRLMLDCGFGIAECVVRLARLGVEPADLDALIVTHEHDDHIGGVARFARKHEIPVYLTYGTLTALGGERASIEQATIIDSHTAFAIGDIEVRPFPVPHDAREPAQFVFGDGAATLGVLTDAGSPTAHISAMLSGLNALVLECNHDADMLASGAYPPALKRRIASRFGHLANDAAAQLLAGLDCSRLQHLIAAHLSQQNNTPELARAAMADAVGCTPEWIGVATQDEGFAWRAIS
ncbi:MAG TPA: MBL fold metallo-hydrolase [Burkholderiales bacterium]|nr:MBL fold metallo-hydrolase [Burkholderiales bacterium]